MISNPLTALYRLVVGLSRNIDRLLKCSTREGCRMSSPAPDRLQILQISTKLKRMNYTTVNINNTINITINGSFAFGSLATTAVNNNNYYHLPRSARSNSDCLTRLRLVRQSRFARLYNSLATLDYPTLLSSTLAVVDSPPFGRFVITIIQSILHHRNIQ